MIPYDGDETATEPPDGVLPDYESPVRVDLIDDAGDNVNGATLNVPLKQLADQLDWVKKRFSRPDASLKIEEDFIGPNTAASGFANATFFGGSIWSLADDSANGASGCIEFNHASSQSDALFTGSALALGTSDLWMSLRLRVPAIGGANSYVKIGLAPLVSGQLLWLVYSPTINGNSHWWLHYGTAALPTTLDTGTAVSTSTYQRMDVVRLSGVLYVFNNGSQVATASPSPFSLDGILGQIACNAATAGTTTAFFDFYKLWAKTGR